MRVLLVTPVPPDRSAPGAIPVLLHAKLTALAERNEVTVLTPAGPEEQEHRSVAALRAEGWHVMAVSRHGATGVARWARRARMAAAWAGRGWPCRTVWFHEPRVQPVLDALLGSGRYDVVGVEDNAMASYQLQGSVASVLTEHEVRKPRPVDWRLGPPTLWPERVVQEVDWRRFRTYQPVTWRRFDALEVFTERDAEVARTLAPDLRDRIEVNPFAVDIPAVAADPACEVPGTIAFVGNYAHPPNVDAARWLALEVLPLVRRSVPEARLELAGVAAPPLVAALAGSNVGLHGFVDEIEAFLARAAVVVAPVRTGGGMRMKVLHAMALGKAVVTTSRGTEGLAVVGVPPVITADNATDLASAIVGLLLDAAGRVRLGSEARAFVEQHLSPSASGKRLQGIYERAVGRRASTSPWKR